MGIYYTETTRRRYIVFTAVYFTAVCFSIFWYIYQREREREREGERELSTASCKLCRLYIHIYACDSLHATHDIISHRSVSIIRAVQIKGHSDIRGHAYIGEPAICVAFALDGTQIAH